MHYWVEPVIKFAQEKNLELYDLKGTDATRKKFESYLIKRSPNFIFINGHGNAQVLTGHDHEIIIDPNSKINSSIVYARSCDSGRFLGKCIVNNGVQAFIGYSRKWTLLFMPEYSTKPLSDPIAKYFIEPSNLIATTIMKGHSAGEAHKRSTDEMKKSVRKMLSSDSTDEEKYAARYVWNNLKAQVLWGDAAAKAI